MKISNIDNHSNNNNNIIEYSSPNVAPLPNHIFVLHLVPTWLSSESDVVIKWV